MSVHGVVFGRRAAAPAAAYRPAAQHRRADSSRELLIRGNRTGLTIAAAAMIAFASFGTIVVRAADDSGVRAFIRESAAATGQSGGLLGHLFRTALAPTRAHRAPHLAREVRPAPHHATKRRVARHAPPVRHAPLHRLASAKGSPHAVAYCVRLCDGYAFPLESGTDMAGAEQSCASACPSAATAVYVAPAGADGVAAAHDREGRAYTALGDAFAYRQAVHAACTCSPGGRGMARPQISQDFTLRRGDLVMLPGGLSIYDVSGRGRHQHARFSDIVTAPHVSRRQRQALLELESGTVVRAGRIVAAERIASAAAFGKAHARGGFRPVPRDTTPDGQFVGMIASARRSVTR